MSTTKTVTEIFDDLDSFREFCVEYGYVFNEQDLYDSKSPVYKKFQKFQAGKKVKNQWAVDKAKFKAKSLGL
jgi:hypothetical protein